MDRPVIVSALRTPVGMFGGALKDIPAPQLAARAVRAALDRVGLPADAVDEVLLGCVLQAGVGQNPARQAALAAGIPELVPATTVNMLCGSGLKSVALAAQAIRAGDADVVVAGGMENMSRAPYLAPVARFGARLGDAALIDSMVHDGLALGMTAATVAERFGITREEQDAFAAASRQKAQRALAAGVFENEIVPIEVSDKRGTRVVDTDEAPRAGDASGLSDGAAVVVMMSAPRAAELGLEGFGSVESHASVGVDPAIMGLGPVPAVRAALTRARLSMGDIDLFELNEAFAAQSLAVIRELGVAPERVNPHGGAIALGHPIGASGARILVSLLHQMRRADAGRGVAALCVGGGQGQAAVIRNGARWSAPPRRGRPRALRERRVQAGTGCDVPGPGITRPRPGRGA